LCSGATTTDVVNNQVAALGASTNLVTVTAGGNDAGFVSLLVNCTLTNCVSSINGTITWVNTQLAGRLDAMDAQIKTRAPNATVIVLGYPDEQQLPPHGDGPEQRLRAAGAAGHGLIIGRGSARAVRLR